MENDFIHLRVRQKYKELVDVISDQDMHLNTLASNLSTLRKENENIRKLVENLKREILENQSHPYALYVDKQTAKHILQEMIEDVSL